MEKEVKKSTLLMIISFLILLSTTAGCFQQSTSKNIQKDTETEFQTAKEAELPTLGNPNLRISSPAFKEGEKIPSAYTCDGENINPQLDISGVPENTKSLILIIDDPDAPKGTFVHWVVWNIPPTIDKIERDSIQGIEGNNGAGKKGYIGPCPPSGTHRYFFKLYASDITLDERPRSDKSKIEEAMQGHIIKKTELIGLYNREQ